MGEQAAWREPIDRETAAVVEAAVRREGLVIALTGAGVSAESGVPTFRGPEGYWTVGSAVYTPQEIATVEMFTREPAAVWAWYLRRFAIVRRVEPNPAHDALARLEEHLGDRFLLITQNGDGLHRRAGSSPERTYEVHGTLSAMRCARPCSRELLPLPEEVLAGVEASAEGAASSEAVGGDHLDERQRALLTCPRCGGWTRPHVLWFDEAYDEEWFRIDSSLRAAWKASLLLTIGTSGATNLPNLVVHHAIGVGAALIDVNPDDNPFGALAQRHEPGAVVRAPASVAVPALCDRIAAVG